MIYAVKANVNTCAQKHTLKNPLQFIYSRFGVLIYGRICSFPSSVSCTGKKNRNCFTKPSFICYNNGVMRP